MTLYQTNMTELEHMTTVQRSITRKNKHRLFMAAHGLEAHQNKQLKTWAKHIAGFEVNWKHA